MSDFNLYSKFWVTYEGTLLSEEASVTINRDPGLQRVDTVAKGFAGVSQGSPSISINVDSGIPAGGFEVKRIGNDMLFANVVVLTIINPLSGEQLISKGFIMSDSSNHAVNSEAKTSFSFLGEWSDFL